jgi:hypothetical protein
VSGNRPLTTLHDDLREFAANPVSYGQETHGELHADALVHIERCEDALRAVLMTHHRCKLSQAEAQYVADRAKALVGPGESSLYDEAQKAATS